MGQFSVEKPVAPGSVLSGNQHGVGDAQHDIDRDGGVNCARRVATHSIRRCSRGSAGRNDTARRTRRRTAGGCRLGRTHAPSSRRGQKERAGINELSADESV
jgi:hypothetical protein